MRCALLPTDAAVAIATVGISSCCFPRRAAVYAATTNCMQPFVLMAVVICQRNFCAHKHVQRNGSNLIGSYHVIFDATTALPISSEVLLALAAVASVPWP